MSTVPQNTSYPALYRACMKQAAAQGRTLMQRLVARAGDSLSRRAREAPDESQRKLLGDAWRTLVKHEGALCEAYPQALLAEFAHAIGGAARKPGALSFDSLELMGDEQMQESVELLRTQHAVLVQVEAELAELSALVCALQGLRSVQTDRNPLRPEVYVRSLRTVTLQSPVPHSMRTHWMQNLGEALGPELAQVYRELCAMLRTQGVEEARFNAVLAAPDNAPQAPVPASQASSLLNLKELRRLLAGEVDPSAAGGRAPGAGARPGEFSATVPAAFEALQEMKQVDKVVARLKQRQAHGAPALAAAVAPAQDPRSQARGIAQALGLEVVQLMVENIAGDARLLSPVAQTVRDLEPALLRLALDDPRFFSDRKHPARRLLEQITQRSLAWENVDAAGFAAFLDPLQQAVEVLLSTRVAGGEPFDFALKTLEEAWGDQQQRDRRYREKAVHALLQAEQRNLLAVKISRQMRMRPELAAVPREVATFLTGAWCQVMAQARVGDATGASDPGGYGALVDDLIWSVQPRLAGADRPRLAGIVPELVHRLRRGLDTIDYPAPAARRFLDQLAAVHGQAVRASEPAASSPMAAQELGAAVEDEEGAEPWLAPGEAQHSGFMETQHLVAPQPVFQETQPGFGDTRPASAGDLGPRLAEAGLQPGAWVEMLTDAGWGRHQLSWASPHGTLFMFEDPGGKTRSMTGRLLTKMHRSGALRMISGQGLVDGALDAVAQAALRNSVEL